MLPVRKTVSPRKSKCIFILSGICKTPTPTPPRSHQRDTAPTPLCKEPNHPPSSSSATLGFTSLDGAYLELLSGAANLVRPTYHTRRRGLRTVGFHASSFPSPPVHPSCPAPTSCRMGWLHSGLLGAALKTPIFPPGYPILPVLLSSSSIAGLSHHFPLSP